MAIHVALSHRTHYAYDRSVALSPHIIRLRPAPHCRTAILSYSLTVAPQRHFINWQQDPHGNYLARVVFPEKTRELTIDVDLVAEMAILNPFDFFLDASAETFPFTYEPWLRTELAPYLEVSVSGSLLRERLAAVDLHPRRTIDFLVDINRQLSNEIAYIIRLEPGVQTPDDTLLRQRGSCRDTAWLLVQMLRSLGMAARFVSGYLIQLTPDVRPLQGPPGAAEDFTDLHAWTEVYLPGAGWVGLDPTSGLLAGEGHLPLAATPDPSSAAPVTGLVEESESTLHHEMRVQRIFESPRVTKPYTERQWEAIVSAGHRVDAELTQLDVRLTMGGEPTFVSIDDMDGAEWNTAATGPTKRALAGALLRRLQQTYAPGGLLHYGQGKWYPGESLPRWALGCWWRRDGVPMWKDVCLIADETVDYGHGEEHARRFITTLGQNLQVDPGHVIPAYEDVWYHLWRERRLPVNVDPFASRLDNEEERTRLARVFERGLDRVVGYVLPLRRSSGAEAPPLRPPETTSHERSGGPSRLRSASARLAGAQSAEAAGPLPDAGWQAGRWSFRGEHLFLLPGDSPIGYRLPLDSLPWLAPGDRPTPRERDLHDDFEPLAPRQRYLGGERPSRLQPEGSLAEQELPHDDDSARNIIRTALCVEPRHGRLHVFIPPLTTTEDYLDLLAAIEETAAALSVPVIVEGSTPPSDPRLNRLTVTPDPGVIEVNLHPARNWNELVDHTVTLYEHARQTRLGTEKFMLDGRHTGTGGGNHIVVGGATPADSPFLRRPDLLRSLLGYWHNHPSLSYLFSGLFIGPTSQHPRVDEARNDSLHELEIAFAQVRDPFDSPGSVRAGGGTPPWLVDRVFRNILVDVTGNTHRAEFCIDKLYAPESSSGRQGLVELRAFEMPPHARMSLTQQLLLRALIAWFWRVPYHRPLARWDTALHDRYMLPHFVAQDFDDVLDDLRRNGHELPSDWFAPHWEFRFPRYGAVTRRGVHVELRQALEPWHVMGEQSAAGGAVRYVDSSVERVQVKTTGLTDTRHVVTCNGRRVPLHPTGEPGESVAGVRYRAWQPANALHPTIPVHAPLVFDIVDTWNDRSLGGCVYHVAHPGGRNFERFPVNAYEAESRRLARFFAIGHTPGPMAVANEAPNPDFPLTLDLRRPRAEPVIAGGTTLAPDRTPGGLETA